MKDDSLGDMAQMEEMKMFAERCDARERVIRQILTLGQYEVSDLWRIDNERLDDAVCDSRARAEIEKSEKLKALRSRGYHKELCRSGRR